MGEALQVLRVDHRGHTATPTGEEDGGVVHAGVVDDVGEMAARSGDGHVSHDAQYGREAR